MSPHFQLVTIYHRSISIFFDDGVELDELTLMVLAVVDQLGKLLADSFDVVEARERHVAIEIRCGGAWVNGEDSHRRTSLLEFDGHHAHHRILCCLAGDIGQGVPVGTDF